ncbi:MAG TPA: GNAT family protein [Lysobacter sp.]|nr:GNAT family protein [Lysobacter sp.]
MPEAQAPALAVPAVELVVDARTRLRPWRAQDRDALLRHANDEQVSRGLRDRFPYPYTAQDAERFLGGQVLDPREPAFAIEIDGEASGGIGAHPGADVERHSAEIGYWLGRAHWGQGHMSRVLAVFAPWAMRTLALHRLWAKVYANNPASARVLEKNGFEFEGRMRCAIVKRGELLDALLYARTRRSLDDAP